MAVSKTRDEAFHYKTIYTRKKWAENRRADIDYVVNGGLGEVVSVNYKAAGLKEELREIADWQRSGNGTHLRGGQFGDANRANLDRRRDLVLEAHDRGWSNADIARALRCSTNSAAAMVKKALVWREEQEGEVAA